MGIAVKDALGKRFELEAPARRIVSLVPSITEALFCLEAGPQVVGVTKFCTEPADAVASKTRVGGPKDLHRDVILDLAPDLVIANVEENSKVHVDALRAAGLPTFITFPRTVREGIQLIRDLGVLAGNAARAEVIAASCDEVFAAVQRSHGRGERIRVFCPIWRRPYMTINADTYVDSMIRTCGGENIFRDRRERYPTISLEETAALGPDLVLLPDEPYPFGQRHLEDFRDLVPAVCAGRLHFLDGKILSWYGPRIAESLKALSKILHGGRGQAGRNDQ